MTSTIQVLDTIELLESILLQLHPRELLVVQRVSKHWQAVINASIKLQQALFFKTTQAPFSFSEAETKGVKVRKNRLLKPLFRLMYRARISNNGNMSSELSDSARIHSSWNVPNASWRKMLPTQPATTDLFAAYYGHDELGEIEKSCSPTNNSVGEIVGEMDKLIQFFRSEYNSGPKLEGANEFMSEDEWESDEVLQMRFGKGTIDFESESETASEEDLDSDSREVKEEEQEDPDDESDPFDDLYPDEDHDTEGGFETDKISDVDDGDLDADDGDPDTDDGDPDTDDDDSDTNDEALQKM